MYTLYKTTDTAEIRIFLKKQIKWNQLNMKSKCIKFRFGTHHLKDFIMYNDDTFLNLFFQNIKCFRQSEYVYADRLSQTDNMQARTSMVLDEHLSPIKAKYLQSKKLEMDMPSPHVSFPTTNIPETNNDNDETYYKTSVSSPLDYDDFENVNRTCTSSPKLHISKSHHSLNVVIDNIYSANDKLKMQKHPMQYNKQHVNLIENILKEDHMSATSKYLEQHNASKLDVNKCVRKQVEEGQDIHIANNSTNSKILHAIRHEIVSKGSVVMQSDLYSYLPNDANIEDSDNGAFMGNDLRNKYSPCAQLTNKTPDQHYTVKHTFLHNKRDCYFKQKLPGMKPSFKAEQKRDILSKCFSDTQVSLQLTAVDYELSGSAKSRDSRMLPSTINDTINQIAQESSSSLDSFKSFHNEMNFAVCEDNNYYAKNNNHERNIKLNEPSLTSKSISIKGELKVNAQFEQVKSISSTLTTKSSTTFLNAASTNGVYAPSVIDHQVTPIDMDSISVENTIKENKITVNLLPPSLNFTSHSEIPSTNKLHDIAIKPTVEYNSIHVNLKTTPYEASEFSMQENWKTNNDNEYNSPDQSSRYVEYSLISSKKPILNSQHMEKSDDYDGIRSDQSPKCLELALNSTKEQILNKNHLDKCDICECTSPDQPSKYVELLLNSPKDQISNNKQLEECDTYECTKTDQVTKHAELELNLSNKQIFNQSLQYVEFALNSPTEQSLNNLEECNESACKMLDQFTEHINSELTLSKKNILNKNHFDKCEVYKCIKSDQSTKHVKRALDSGQEQILNNNHIEKDYVFFCTSPVLSTKDVELELNSTKKLVDYYDYESLEKSFNNGKLALNSRKEEILKNTNMAQIYRYKCNVKQSINAAEAALTLSNDQILLNSYEVGTDISKMRTTYINEKFEVNGIENNNTILEPGNMTNLANTIIKKMSPKVTNKVKILDNCILPRKTMVGEEQDFKRLKSDFCQIDEANGIDNKFKLLKKPNSVKQVPAANSNRTIQSTNYDTHLVTELEFASPSSVIKFVKSKNYSEDFIKTSDHPQYFKKYNSILSNIINNRKIYLKLHHTKRRTSSTNMTNRDININNTTFTGKHTTNAVDVNSDWNNKKSRNTLDEMKRIQQFNYRINKLRVSKADLFHALPKYYQSIFLFTN